MLQMMPPPVSFFFFSLFLLSLTATAGLHDEWILFCCCSDFGEEILALFFFCSDYSQRETCSRRYLKIEICSYKI
jgi:hypothetical protein